MVGGVLLHTSPSFCPKKAHTVETCDPPERKKGKREKIEEISQFPRLFYLKQKQKHMNYS